MNYILIEEKAYRQLHDSLKALSDRVIEFADKLNGNRPAD